jgi:hypothetical protein
MVLPVKFVTRISLILFICLLHWQQVYGQSDFPQPNWDRAIAVNTAKSINTNNVLRALYQSSRAGDSRQVMEILLAVERNDNWPVPAREYTIWAFTIGLSDMAVNSVSTEVLDYLSAYRPRTLVAHDDRDSVGVPLYNISAAAAGVYNSWARQRGADRAEALLQSDPDEWTDAFLRAGPAARKGFSDTLQFASDQQLNTLVPYAIKHLTEHPELTAVAGQSALILADLNLLQQTLALGSGPELHRILQAASQVLDVEEKKILLFQTIHQGPDRMAGLAIAQLAPALLNDPVVQEKMFEMLENRELGSSAALILGSSKDSKIRERLRRTAVANNGLASQRASLAIATERHKRNRE